MQSLGYPDALTKALLMRCYITLLKQKEKSELPAHENKTPKYYIFDDIIHTSKAMTDCIAYAKKVAPTDANIMLYGETGSGKAAGIEPAISP